MAVAKTTPCELSIDDILLRQSVKKKGMGGVSDGVVGLAVGLGFTIRELIEM